MEKLRNSGRHVTKNWYGLCMPTAMMNGSLIVNCAIYFNGRFRALCLVTIS
jgi:hypothetical protein